MYISSLGTPLSYYYPSNVTYAHITGVRHGDSSAHNCGFLSTLWHNSNKLTYLTSQLWHLPSLSPTLLPCLSAIVCYTVAVNKRVPRPSLDVCVDIQPRMSVLILATRARTKRTHTRTYALSNARTPTPTSHSHNCITTSAPRRHAVGVTTWLPVKPTRV